MKKLLVILLLSVIVACEPEPEKESPSLGPTQPPHRKEMVRNPLIDLKISPNNEKISSEEAINVAKIANIMSAAKTKSAVKEVDNVVTISNEKGEPLIYAVNYSGNRGYSLISATKDYYPILANVDKGVFNEDINERGVSVLLDEYDYVITNSSQFPDELKSEMRNEKVMVYV